MHFKILWIKFWLLDLSVISRYTTYLYVLNVFIFGDSIFSWIKCGSFIHSINIECLPRARLDVWEKWRNQLSELRDSTGTLHVKSHYKEEDLRQHKNLLRHDNYGKCPIQCNKVILYPGKLILLPKYYSQSSVYTNIGI